ncbi:hypothetical protein [Halorubrum laminariae]|uniref:Uncharacterized protein n=1 Tax=Halorubrum laminariae TaxID=1433523 RepID=A0ABD6C1Y4_9EURY|nr:hypothetical protein [Halorubrum laminariae]
MATRGSASGSDAREEESGYETDREEGHGYETDREEGLSDRERLPRS